MKAKFLLNTDGSVTLAYDDVLWGGRVEDVFHTGKSDGLSYVYNASGRQICTALSESGETLMTSRYDLLSTIKKEYRKMVKRNARI